MANPSLVSTSGGKHLRVAQSPAPVVVPKMPATMPSPAQTGPRKLVRPHLPTTSQATRLFARRPASPLTGHHPVRLQAVGDVWRESSHAEVFYFQKQMHAQTMMTIVLDDGESIEGVIEWYDQDVIKVRHGGRTLIYKSCIKYLYKSEDTHKL